MSESGVQQHTSELRKELGLWDLVLTQILFVTGLTNLGTAAKLGDSHLVFWLTGVVTFYIPLAIVVIQLNRWKPLEGGLYQWAKAAFGDLAGFLVAWNLWLYAIALISSGGLITTTSLSYALSLPSLADNKLANVTASFLSIGGLTIVSILGLRLGKWIFNLGASILLIFFAALLAARFVGHEHHQLTLVIPTLSLLNLNLLSKLSFYALGGFEYVAVFAGECTDPKLIGRSVLISAPIIAGLFIIGTDSVLAVVAPANIDLVNPVAQVLSIAAKPFPFIFQFISIVFFAKLAAQLAQSSINFAVNSRLPMVAGWDHLLPAWFTRLHPRYRTPINSILFLGTVTFIVSLGGVAGVGRQEGFQLLSSASQVFYGLAYLAMFAIPMAGMGSSSFWIRIAAVSGFLMTLLSVVLSVFPIIDVPNPLAFTAKVSTVVLIANLFGLVLYRTNRPAGDTLQRRP